MESDSDDDLVLLTGLSSLITIKKKKRRKPPVIWVNKYLQHRSTKGRFVKDFWDMRSTPEVFKENFHMSPEQFDQLYALLLPRLTPKKMTRPDCLSGQEKLAITLEFLASGSFQRHIASCYRLSKQRLGAILESTWQAIFEVLQALYPLVNVEHSWTDTLNKFNVMWNFPNCVGAIDGKHCALKCPKGGASLFYNHKGFHSIILMAVADAECKFTYFDVGSYGSEGDSTVFSSCEFGKKLTRGQLNLPKDQLVFGRKVSFAFLADDAFPLTTKTLKPYKPTKQKPFLDVEQRIFNYRLSRARRCVENAFGILCARWQCLARTLFLNPEKAQKIIASCCVLHNYMMRERNDGYCPPGFIDTYDATGNLGLGSFRQVIPENSMFHTQNPLMRGNIGGRPITDALQQRDHLKNFFNSAQGQLDWQRRSIFLSD